MGSTPVPSATKGFAVSVKEFLEDLTKNSRDLYEEARMLEAIRDWAYRQQPVSEGDRVRVAESWGNRDHGRYEFFDVIHVGAEGVAHKIKFNCIYDYWYALVKFDNDPDGYTFMVNVEDLEPVELSYAGIYSCDTDRTNDW